MNSSRNRTRVKVALARVARVACVATLGIVTACIEHDDTRFDWNRMRSQPKLLPFGGSVLRPAMRLPPAGTIAREYVEDTVALATPDLNRGRSRYQIFCAACHGASGDGNSVVAANMEGTKPPSLVDGNAALLNTQQLLTVIAHGRNRMPEFASVMPAVDRQQLAAYVLSLRGTTQTAAPVRR